MDATSEIFQVIGASISAYAFHEQARRASSPMHPITDGVLKALDGAPRPYATLASGVRVYQVAERARRVELWVTEEGYLALVEHLGRFGRDRGLAVSERETRGVYDIGLVLVGSAAARLTRPRHPVGVRATQRLLRRLERLGARVRRRDRDAVPSAKLEAFMASVEIALLGAQTMAPNDRGGW